MFKNEVMLILPKASAYNLKTYDEQRIIKNIVEKYVSLIKEKGKKVCCFSTDFLAVQLLSEDKDVIWYNVLGNADTHYIKALRDITPSAYSKIEVTNLQTTAQKAASKKYTVEKDLGKKDATEDEYKSARERVMNQRCRYICNAVLRDCITAVIYIDASNNFCNAPEPKYGKSNTILIHELTTGIVQCWYSGLSVEESIFNKVL